MERRVRCINQAQNKKIDIEIKALYFYEDEEGVHHQRTGSRFPYEELWTIHPDYVTLNKYGLKL